MAFCPNCHGTMGAVELACPNCGYDFPEARSTDPAITRTFPYSPLADLALIAATIASSISCAVTLFIGVSFLVHREWLHALVYAPLVFLVQLGIVVVFLRIQQMDR